MRRLAGLAALAAATAIAGCGSSAPATVTQSAAAPATATQTAAAAPAAQATSKAQAAKEYLAAIAPFKAADKTADAQLKAEPDSAPAATFAKITAPVAQALTNTHSSLLAIARAYPPAASDIKGLVTASAPLIADMDNLGTQTGFSATSWEQQTISDGTAMTAAAAIVRSDLGLPATTA
jgi:hypothetical protein